MTPNYEALEQLIRVLEQVRDGDGAFTLEDWVHDTDIEEMDEERAEQIIRQSGGHACGSAACAIGWACQDPWFIAQGFRLDMYEDCLGDVTPVPMFGREDGWAAVREFLRLDQDTAEHLFASHRYTAMYPYHYTIDTVIGRIREVVEAGVTP